MKLKVGAIMRNLCCLIKSEFSQAYFGLTKDDRVGFYPTKLKKTCTTRFLKRLKPVRRIKYTIYLILIHFIQFDQNKYYTKYSKIVSINL